MSEEMKSQESKTTSPLSAEQLAEFTALFESTPPKQQGEILELFKNEIGEEQYKKFSALLGQPAGEQSAEHAEISGEAPQPPASPTEEELKKERFGRLFSKMRSVAEPREQTIKEQAAVEESPAAPPPESLTEEQLKKKRFEQLFAQAEEAGKRRKEDMARPETTGEVIEETVSKEPSDAEIRAAREILQTYAPHMLEIKEGVLTRIATGENPRETLHQEMEGEEGMLDRDDEDIRTLLNEEDTDEGLKKSLLSYADSIRRQRRELTDLGQFGENPHETFVAWTRDKTIFFTDREREAVLRKIKEKEIDILIGEVLGGEERKENDPLAELLAPMEPTPKTSQDAPTETSPDFSELLKQAPDASQEVSELEADVTDIRKQLRDLRQKEHSEQKKLRKRIIAVLRGRERAGRVKTGLETWKERRDLIRELLTKEPKEIQKMFIPNDIAEALNEIFRYREFLESSRELRLKRDGLWTRLQSVTTPEQAVPIAKKILSLNRAIDEKRWEAYEKIFFTPREESEETQRSPDESRAWNWWQSIDPDNSEHKHLSSKYGKGQLFAEIRAAKQKVTERARTTGESPIATTEKLHAVEEVEKIAETTKQQETVEDLDKLLSSL